MVVARKKKGFDYSGKPKGQSYKSYKQQELRRRNKELKVFKKFFGTELGTKRAKEGMVVSLRLNPGELYPLIRFAYKQQNMSLGDVVKLALRKQFSGKRDERRLQELTSHVTTIGRANDVIEENQRLLVINKEYEKLLTSIVEKYDQFVVNKESFEGNFDHSGGFSSRPDPQS